MENQNETNEREKNWLLPASIVIAAVLIAGAVIYSTGLKNIQRPTNNQTEQNTEQNATPTSSGPQIGDDVVLGNADAPITLIEFGDFQCPFCAKFYKEIEEPLITKYVKTGKIKMVYKPLAFLDRQSPIKESQAAVNAVKCAQEQGKFWEYHDAIFEIEYAEVEKVLSGQLSSNEGNGNLNRDLFKKIASDLKMNVDEFLSCYDSKRHQNDFQKYMDEAESVLPQGISTPSVFINGKHFEFSMNAQREFDFAAFSAAIDTVLNKK